MEEEELHQTRFRVGSKNLLEPIDPERSLILEHGRRQAPMAVCDDLVFLLARKKSVSSLLRKTHLFPLV